MGQETTQTRTRRRRTRRGDFKDGRNLDTPTSWAEKTKSKHRGQKREKAVPSQQKRERANKQLGLLACSLFSLPVLAHPVLFKLAEIVSLSVLTLAHGWRSARQQ